MDRAQHHGTPSQSSGTLIYQPSPLLQPGPPPLARYVPADLPRHIKGIVSSYAVLVGRALVAWPNGIRHRCEKRSVLLASKRQLAHTSMVRGHKMMHVSADSSTPAGQFITDWSAAQQAVYWHDGWHAKRHNSSPRSKFCASSKAYMPHFCILALLSCLKCRVCIVLQRLCVVVLYAYSCAQRSGRVQRPVARGRQQLKKSQYSRHLGMTHCPQTNSLQLS
jgi:predicted hotdog family 3-hydroxylacyl-ACP dehydratase